jgi:sulfide:quinone oxidoreductase
MRGGGSFRVIVAGAGVAGLETVLALRHLAHEPIQVEVLEPGEHFVYRPLAVAEPFGAGRVHRFPFPDLLGPAGARHRRDALAEVQPDERRLVTEGGKTLEYEALVVACGGQVAEGLPGALSFGGSEDRQPLEGLLDELAAGSIRRVVFAVPGGPIWPLPLYELALMTATRVAKLQVDASLALLTPEPEPLALFGRTASEAVAELLAERGIEVIAGRHPIAVEQGAIRSTSGPAVTADRVVSLPRIQGPRVAGLPCDADGFIPVTDQGAVRGVPGVYAAGDATAFPLKQGGIAAQEADAVAEAVAARAGAPITPQPFRPVIRGLLLTGGVPHYLRAEVAGGLGDTSTVDIEPLWWPPGKVAGRYLAPYLADLIGETTEPAVPPGVEVEVELEFREPS